MGVIYRVLQWLAWLGRLLLPGSEPRKPQRLWLKRLLLVGLILTALALCNRFFRLNQLVEAPLGWPGEVWLPLVVLIAYLSLWCGWWMWQFATRPIESPFADLDNAWRNTLTQLAQAGIDLTEVPLFVVLGLPLSGEDGLIKGSQINFTVQRAPRPDAAIQVYANSEIILVFCHNASVLCKLARYASGVIELSPVPTRPGKPRPQQPEASFFGGSDAEVALRPTQATQPVGLPGIATLAPAVRDHLVGLSRLQIGSPESQLWTARLTHLIDLIRQARQPYCSINGLLVLLPQSVLASQPEQLAALVGYEVSAVLDAAQVHASATLLVCDLEESEAFGEFLARMPSEKLANTLGVCMPDTSELDLTSANAYSAVALDWLSLRLQQLVNRLLLLPLDAGHTACNRRLVRLLLDWPGYHRGLKQLIERLHAVEPHLLGTPNVYLAATGKLSTAQGFLPDVFVNLLETQNRVAWTEAARASDRWRWRAAITAWAFFILGVCLLVVLAVR